MINFQNDLVTFDQSGNKENDLITIFNKLPDQKWNNNVKMYSKLSGYSTVSKYDSYLAILLSISDHYRP